MKALFVMALVSLLGCEAGNVELPLGAHKGASTVSPSGNKSKFAMVSTPGFPGECLPGVIRSEPWGEMVATIPSGTLVWLGESKTAPDPKSKQPKKWWRVKVWLAGAPISGWMHSNILKPPVWDPPAPEAPIDSDSLE